MTLRRLSVALAAVVCLGAGAIPAHAGSFAELLVERNLTAEGPGVERFALGDGVHRMNGGLSVDLPLGSSYPVASRMSYGFTLKYSSSLWTFEDSGAVRASLDRRWNAGAGWSLAFGSLSEPTGGDGHWVYAWPDGRRSRFYDELVDGAGAVAGTHYSRDSTLLRLTVVPSGLRATVAFDDGREKLFDRQADGSWRLTQDRDVHGNWVRYTYLPGEIQVSDLHGRAQRIVFQPDPAGTGGEVIDRLELSAFGGATAVYDLAYAVQSVPVPSQDTDPATPATLAAAVLVSVTRPDGTVTRFAYDHPNEPFADGRLGRVTLATGGEIDYRYQVIELPILPAVAWAADVVGVASRTISAPGNRLGGLVGPPSMAPVGTWTFARTLDRDRHATDGLLPRELTSRLTFPDGHAREWKFAVFVGGDPSSDTVGGTSFYLRDYGLPFTKRDALVGDYHYTSEIVYDAAGVPVRSIRVKYEFDGCSGCWDRNPRVVGERVTWEDGSGLVEDTFHGIDDLGRRTVTYEMDDTGAPVRKTTRTFASGLPAPSAPWVVTPWSERQIAEGGVVRVIQRCVDPATGLVTRERTLAGTVPAAHDLLSVTEVDARGDRSVVRYYGGDVQTLDTGALCTLSLPATEQYAQGWTYSAGVMSSHAWLDSQGGTFLPVATRQIDPSTGLVATSDGADGFRWTHSYDALGQRTSSTPPAGHGGTEILTHEPASGSLGTRTTREVLGADGTVLSRTQTELDALHKGRSKRTMGAAGWHTTTMRHDAMGRQVALTLPDGSRTVRSDFDPFGRPGSVVPPEGSVHQVHHTYAGRTVASTEWIGKRWDEVTDEVEEIVRTTTVGTDRFGRRVHEQITDADGESRTTTYAVGLEGILGTSTTDGSRSDSWTRGDRTDGRGFLVENEDGEPIDGYDALGHLTVVDHGQGPIAMLFDRAGRLVEEREGSATGPLWASNVYAAPGSGPDYRGGKLVQSLRVNRDVPHLPTSVVQVRDTFTYDGDGGSLSARRTTVSSGSQTIFSFVATRTVDASGTVTTSVFPDCDPTFNDGFSLCEPRARREMRTVSSFGLPLSFTALVGGQTERWIDSIDRDGADRVTATHLGNDLVEERDYGVSGRLERLRLTDSGVSTVYDSGLAQYDGRGKLVRLGAERKISDLAYSLRLPAPANASSAAPTPASTGTFDALGQPTRRSYRLPLRSDPASGQFEAVTEIYVYGPGNRLVWNRRFNSHQAQVYRNSIDVWSLTDTAGRTVREADAITYYLGQAPDWSTAQAASVWMHVAGRPTRDRIYWGGELLGTATDSANAPDRTFVHRDFLGHRMARSTGTGDVVGDGASLY